MTPSKALFWFCIAFIVGILLESFVKIPQVILWGFLIAAVLIIIASFFLNKKMYTIVGFCILFSVLGIVRFQVSEFTIANDALSKFNDGPDKITLIGQISAEPDIRDNSQKLKVRVTHEKSIILITVQRYPEYKYLDKIKITGKLKTPAVFDNFNYKEYLMKDGIYSVMDFPKAELVSDKHHYNIFTFLYEKILLLKGKLTQSVDMSFAVPDNTIVQGIVFGNDKNMPKDLKDQFNTTGLSHVTAVSGSNIVIVISLAMAFLLFLGFWRGQAFYVAVIFIWLYIILIGFPVSGIRAAIMGSMALLAAKLGRQNTSSRALVLTASAMLLQNPLLLFYDVSFQLSFLASLGIIYLKPLIDALLHMSKKGALKMLSDIISVTFAAQLFTLPIIVYNFGNISLVSPITNILILPIIPLLTVLGFLVSVFGIFSNILGFIFSLPCWFLLMYFEKVLDIFSKPWAVKTLSHISWMWLAIYYFILAVVIFYLNKKQKPKFLGY